MADETKNTTNKVFDIAPKASATPTSRPVIVGHGPLMHDPTIVDAEKEGEETPKEDEKILSPTRELKLKPLDDNIKPESAPEAEPAKEDVSKDDSVKADSDPETDGEKIEVKTGQTKKADNQEQTDSVESNTDEAKPDEGQKDTDKTSDEVPKPVAPNVSAQTEAEHAKQEAAEAEAELEHHKHIADLVSGQKFFLSINQVEKRRNQRAVIIGAVLILLLAVAWLDVALDAGLISNGYNLPHTHFFAVKS